ncbi:unannotated protein [freshwater metagenome]|uniref:Unannotated protein n=1 Tax=freshwater metagenome TaxID=449393 RepID=A0A6J7FTT9_9ZZZZ
MFQLLMSWSNFDASQKRPESVVAVLMLQLPMG